MNSHNWNWRRAGFTIAVGLALGAIWDALLMPVATGDVADWTTHLASFAVGGGIIGLVVLMTHKLYEAWGAFSGVLLMMGIAVVVAPKDGWIVMWIIFYGINGIALGVIIGLVVRLSDGRYRTRD